MMKFAIFSLLLVLLSCSNGDNATAPKTPDSSTPSLLTQKATTFYDTMFNTPYVSQIDTIFIYDTTVVSHRDSIYISDTVYVSYADSVFIYDTTVVSHKDSIYVFDTVYASNTDTIVEVIRDAFTVDDIPMNKSLIIPDGSDTLNIVYFGNSLVKGYGFFGMSASVSMYDFSARVNRYFSLLGYDVNGVRASAERFEKVFGKSEHEEILVKNLYPQLNESIDIVVIQLGDNVSNGEELAEFKDSFVELIDSVRSRISNDAKIICVSSWYTYETVNLAREFIKKTALEKEAVFVDISDLYADEDNRSYLGAVVYKSKQELFGMSYDDISEDAGLLTITFTIAGKRITSTIEPDSYDIDREKKVVSWIGHEFIVNDAGIASHPCNRGFARIAERVIRAIEKNYLLKTDL